MKKLALALMLLSSTALALPGGGETYSFETQALTRSAPTAADFTITVGSSVGKSMWLMELNGYRVSVCAAAGQTLSGSGNLRAWMMDERSGQVMRGPSLDFAVNATGVRCQVFPDVKVWVVSSGRVIFAADTITVSGGTTVDVQIIGDKQ